MRRKRFRKLTGILAAVSLMAAALTSMPAYADAEKVVTLGADLSQEDQNRILKYFGVLGQDIRTIYVTNDEERALLSSWIPLSVIGTRTLSCAYVKPTNSGGIQVKTANLNWVTSNMIASALSTSGVKNCEVIAACPREVSGTGALTGVLKAYEYASSAVLDPKKKEVAAQEIATVSNIADVVGQTEATQLINDIKIQIIEQQVPAEDLGTIQEIVDAAVANVESEMQMKLDEVTDVVDGMSVRESLDSLAANIAAQEYDYEEVRETLERVEKNVSELKAAEPASVNVNVNIDNQAFGGSSNAEGGSSNAEGGSSNAEGGNSSAAGGNASSDAQGGNAAADAAGGDSSAAVGSEEPELAEDSILLNTDDSALGEDVVMSATTEEAVPFVPEAAQAPQAADEENNDLFEIVTTDEGTFGDDASGGESAVIDETGNEGPTATEEAPSSESLFEDQPAADETPAAEDQPAADEMPVTEDQPAAETPVTEDQPADEVPVSEDVFEDQPADEVPVSEDLFEDQPADEVPVSEDVFEDQPADEVPVSEDMFEDQPAADEVPVSEDLFEDQSADEMPADEYVPEDEAAADETYDEFAVDEYEEETYNEDISGDEELTGDPDENADGDIFADEPDEPVADEGADEPESESAPAPLLSVGSEGDKSVDGFSLSLFAEGDVVPVSGKVTITDADGAEVAVIDLSDPDSFGVVPAEGSAVSGDFAGGDATEIHVLTSGAGLGEGTYTVKATDVVFADNDGSGSAEAGTERPAAEASGKLTYAGSAAEPLQSGKSSYTAPGEADFQLYAPEGTSSVDAVSSDEGVASVLAYDEETQVLTVDLLNTGDAQINVTYYDEEGGILGEDSIPLAVF